MNVSIKHIYSILLYMYMGMCMYIYIFYYIIQYQFAVPKTFQSLLILFMSHLVKNLNQINNWNLNDEHLFSCPYI